MTENTKSIKNEELPEKLELMLMDERFCDTIFLVNNSKFHASSHLVGVFSPVLFNMIENQHENCADREVKLTEIQLDPSFSILLDYIYGISLNTPEVDINVLCEALLVSERFEVKSFSEKLKCYLSGLKIYHIDYLAVLLNTAKTFQLVELYEKLRDFACNNSEQFLKHRNFVNLKFDVLKELIQLDTFGSAEIDILSGILEWHYYNMYGDNLTYEDEVLQNSAAMDCEFDMEESENDDSTFNRYLITLSRTPVNKEIVDTFRKNVLKSLLSHVRINSISMLVMFQALSKQVFIKYREDLLQGDYFSQSSVPRSPPVHPVVELRGDQFNILFKKLTNFLIMFTNSIYECIYTCAAKFMVNEEGICIPVRHGTDRTLKINPAIEFIILILLISVFVIPLYLYLAQEIDEASYSSV